MQPDTTDSMLPWRRTGVARSYDRDRQELDVSTDDARNVFTIRKQRPNEPQAGWFCVYHNDERISNGKHEYIAAARDEAEAYFYSLPQFAKSGNAVALGAMFRIGQQDFIAGTSVLDASKYSGASREKWLTGWLNAYANAAMQQVLAGVEPTMRANQQLEHDLLVMTNRATSFTYLIEYTCDVLPDDAARMAFVRSIRDLSFVNDVAWRAWLAEKTKAN